MFAFIISSRMGKRIFAFACAIALICSTLSVVAAEELPAGVPLKEKFAQKETTDIKGISQSEAPSYIATQNDYAIKGYKPVENQTVSFDVLNPSGISSGDVVLRNDLTEDNSPVLYWDEAVDWIEWTIDVPETGLYNVEMTYYPVEGKGTTIQRSIAIDGVVPFIEAYNVPFYRIWKDSEVQKFNNIGDEIRPKQIEVREWKTVRFWDNQGMSVKPLEFYFTEGRHTVRLYCIDEPIAIKSLKLVSPIQYPKYEQMLQEYKSKGYKEATQSVKFQAESNTIAKNESVIRRESDSDPKCEPQSNMVRRLNVMGGSTWKLGGQEITWQFEVPEEGLYKISMRTGQWWNDGMSSFRQIMINGVVPFEEMLAYPFEYQRDWHIATISDSDGNPYLFHLNKGINTITMKVVAGPVAEVIQEVKDDTFAISEWYRKIIMLTSRNPDPNYEYELDKNVPGLVDGLFQLSERMQKKADLLSAVSNKKGSVINNFITIRDQFRSMAEKPDTISRRLNDINNAQTSLGSYILSLNQMPLIFDYFEITPPDEKLPSGKASGLEKAWVTWINFLRSFVKDYDNIGGVAEGAGGPTISVWSGRGKEWSELIKQMADEDFTPKTGINVNMNILPSGQLSAGAVNALMLAITSGRAPDVATGVDVNSPVEFAIRGATIDLSKFNDFEEIATRFYPQTLVPFKYQGGTYALPDQMNFNVLMYRKDILNELGIKVPNTWNEIYEKVLPVLYQNNMEFMPAGFQLFLFQNGGDYYTPDGLKSALDTPEAYKAFKEWTDQYIAYGMPASANFFNRFRNGEMPMGIVGYGEYIQMATAAPELFGRWDIALVPGHVRSDGTIDRSIGAITGQCTMILAGSREQEAAWEFIKWWTSKDVQTRFGRELESLLGITARWNSANIEAFKASPWDREHKEIILQQMEWGKEQPVVLGGYFTSRHVTNAWTRVVTGGQIPRDSLEQAVKDINKELLAKQEEYGVTGNE